MKHMFDMDLDPVSTNFYTRTSRSKYEDTCPISKIEDYQTSMSVFSTRIESKNNRANSDYTKRNKKKKKKGDQRKVQFNPLITVVNIESYKKENYEGTFDPDPEGRCGGQCISNNNNNIKKCILCSIF